LAGKQVHRLLRSGTNTGDYGATVRSADNAWAAIGLSKQLKQIWSVDLRSQLLENPVEPIAVGQNSAGEIFWAVVDDENTVCLIWRLEIRIAYSGFGDFDLRSRS